MCASFRKGDWLRCYHSPRSLVLTRLALSPLRILALPRNICVDISATLETKVQAIALYDSEARPFPPPRSPEALRAIARRWGSVVGKEAVEAFEVIRAVR